MIVNIHFDTDNAAFEDSFLMEVTRVLLAAKSVIISSNNTIEISNCKLIDSNGNKIGSVSITNDVAVESL